MGMVAMARHGCGSHCVIVVARHGNGKHSGRPNLILSESSLNAVGGIRFKFGDRTGHIADLLLYDCVGTVPEITSAWTRTSLSGPTKRPCVQSICSQNILLRSPIIGLPSEDKIKTDASAV